MAMALTAAQLGYAPTLVDSRPHSAQARQTSQTFILTLPTVEMLRNLGVWSDIRPGAYPVRRIDVDDRMARKPSERAPLSFGQLASDSRPLTYVVEAHRLQAALDERVRDTSAITHVRGAGLEEITHDEGAATAILNDGRRLSARLIVGSDGRGSATARASGIARKGRPFAQKALVFTIRHAPRTDNIAHQFLLSEGPLSVLPLSSIASSIMWAAPPDGADHLMQLAQSDFEQRLEDRLGHLLGAPRLDSDRFCFPLQTMVARQFAGRRTLLLGDAAHVFHPVTGQGLNYGFRDIATLATLLRTAKQTGQDIGGRTLLRKYQSCRRLDAVAMATTTNAIVSLFGNSNPILSAGRRAGLIALGAMPRLQGYLVRKASGDLAQAALPLR